MENGSISDSQITASSQDSGRHAARLARLNYRGTPIIAGSWSARSDDLRPWLQVDFGAKVNVFKIATQGRFDADQWVKSYYLNHSHDGAHFEAYRHSGMIKVRHFDTTQSKLDWVLFQKGAKSMYRSDTFFWHMSLYRFGINFSLT